MNHTYLKTAAILPASKSLLLPRPEGDGMDSETLKIKELAPPSDLTSLSRRHKNLASSPKTATVSRGDRSHFVPHEPVRGAVKAVSPPQGQLPGSQSSTGQLSPNRSPPTQGHVGYTKGSTECPDQVKAKAAKSKNAVHASLVQTEPAKAEKVKTIQVPLYSAPGFLSHDTYKMLQKQQQLQQQTEGQGIGSGTAVLVPTSPKKVSSLDANVAVVKAENPPDTVVTVEDIVQEARQVEGDNRTVSMADLEKMNDEIEELRKELEGQTKVNSDLKKLLVASMGDDLHYKVDRLVQDKAHLAEEVGQYSRKLHQDYEDIDKLSIQADMWMSKFKASRMMTDKLTQQNMTLRQQYQSAHLALQRLLQERQQMKEWLTQTFRFLYQVKAAFDPPHTQRPGRTGPQTLLSLSQAVMDQGENVKLRLLGPNSSTETDEEGLQAGTVDALSPAEAYAFQVLSTPTEPPPFINRSHDPSEIPEAAPYTLEEKYSRFHPDTKYEKLTIDICRKCKGDINVI